MAVTPGLGALPTLEAMTRSTDVQQLDTTQAQGMQNQQSAQAMQNMNQYSGGQSGLQNQVVNQGGQLLQGNYPQAGGLSDAVRQKAFMDFNRYQAPQLAAQHGAGSPAIQAALESLQLGLAAQDQDFMLKQQNQALSAYDAAGKYAFTPLGNNQNQTSSQFQNTANNQTQNRVANENMQQLSSGMDMSALYDWLNPPGYTTTGGGASAPAVPGGTAPTSPFSGGGLLP